MKKFFDKIRKNNKGFTLVELIIVIAVMAILTVVAAPQYIKYVENSRVGTDENAFGEIAHIAEIEFVGFSVDNTVSDDITFTVVTNSDGEPTFTVTSGDNTNKDLENAIKGAFGDYNFKSTTYRGKTITFTIDAVNDAKTAAGTGKCTAKRTIDGKTVDVVK